MSLVQRESFPHCYLAYGNNYGNQYQPPHQRHHQVAPSHHQPPRTSHHTYEKPNMEYEKPGRSLPAVSNALYASRHENQYPRDPVAPNKDKRVYCIVAVICVLLALAMAAALVLYVMLNDSDDSDSAETEPVSLQLITKDNDGAYTDAMADPTSDDFKNVESEHCSTISTALDGNNCKVLSVKEGSRIIDFLIDVLKRVDEALDDLLQEITDKLNRENLNVLHSGRALGMCRTTTCQNGGTCVGVRGAAVCDCAAGYEGINCADAIQTTATVPATPTRPRSTTLKPTPTGTSSPTATSCGHGELRCTDGSCVSGIMCDSVQDCLDGSDEEECRLAVCDGDTFQCGDGQCKYYYTWCDGYPDCPDGSDEPENCAGTCAPGQLQCNGSGECVSSSSICDGLSQCEDREDERRCNCSLNQFECDEFCVNEYKWCDGTVDCPESGLDELDCNDVCSPNSHNCLLSNGSHCLSYHSVCNGKPDCMDWSDELDPNCPLCENENATRCNDPPACLLPEYWCAGQAICPDGSDSPVGCECRAYQFDCGSGTVKCLPLEKVCDGIVDCADKSDELQECECYENQKRCDTGLCVNDGDWCNGIDDCGDFSDELGCECTYRSLPCDDGESCFADYQYCDGFPNCRDRTDEPPGCSCYDEQFNCSGVCIPQLYVCDGNAQCPGGLDEKDCECSGYQCTETFECYPESYRCDGDFDCTDKSDELGCGDCKEDWFSCANGYCIDGGFVCDQYDNCGDNSDEAECDYTCLDDEFKCSAGNCVPKVWLCDLIADCGDGDDEDRAHCANCARGDKPCRGGGTCYQPSQTCDGVQHCPYGEDEYNCVTLNKEPPFALKATKDNVAYDGICSDNWSDDWSSAACAYLGYESAGSHTFLQVPNLVHTLVLLSSSPSSAPLLTALAPGNCASGHIVSVKCNSKECGIVPLHSNSFSPYIINGQNAEAGQWPWQIQLLKLGKPQCGGSVINKFWVLTAAHCVTTSTGLYVHPSTFAIRAGALKSGLPDPNSRNYGVAKFIVHPEYHSGLFDNDIALVKLTHPIEYTDYIQPACLAEKDYDIDKAVECYISGWGAERLIANPTHLKQAKMDILDNDYCTQVAREDNGKRWPMRNWNVRTETQICVGFPQKPISACYGDSGGPLVCRDEHFHWTLAGVTSYGTLCKGISVYARVTYFKEWIDLQISQNPTP